MYKIYVKCIESKSIESGFTIDRIYKATLDDQNEFNLKDNDGDEFRCLPFNESVWKFEKINYAVALEDKVNWSETSKGDIYRIDGHNDAENISVEDGDCLCFEPDDVDDPDFTKFKFFKTFEELDKYSRELKTKELIKDKWYRYNNGLFNYQGLNNGIIQGYGFLSSGGWTNICNLGNDFNEWKEATDEEVGDALLKEANLRFKTGTGMSNSERGTVVTTINSSTPYALNHCKMEIQYGLSVRGGGAELYSNGKWAKVISNPEPVISSIDKSTILTRAVKEDSPNIIFKETGIAPEEFINSLTDTGCMVQNIREGNKLGCVELECTGHKCLFNKRAGGETLETLKAWLIKDQITLSHPKYVKVTSIGGNNSDHPNYVKSYDNEKDVNSKVFKVIRYDKTNVNNNYPTYICEGGYCLYDRHCEPASEGEYNRYMTSKGTESIMNILRTTGVSLHHTIPGGAMDSATQNTFTVKSGDFVTSEEISGPKSLKKKGKKRVSHEIYKIEEL